MPTAMPDLKQKLHLSADIYLAKASCSNPPGQEQVVKGTAGDLCNADGTLDLARLSVDLQVHASTSEHCPAEDKWIRVL